ncbi:hypothetical protein FKM82_012050, partial [Ascaphus truei]
DAIKTDSSKEGSYLPSSSLVTHRVTCCVEQYKGVLITLLENQIKPDAICSSLSLCHADQSEPGNPELLTNQILEKLLPFVQENLYNLHSSTTQEQGTRGDLPIPLPLCWMCRSFIRRVESTIPKDAIAKAASKLCLFLPGKIAGVCQCLIEKYTVIILDTILGKLGPQLVCGLLFMCSSGENCGADLPVIPVLASEVACDTCLAVTSLVKPTMAKNVTQEEIEDALLRACSNPALDWNECQRFLQQHQTKLSQLLPKPWDHRTTCQEVGACPSGNTAAPEDSGCADGPSYWCISLDTAKQCEVSVVG